MLGEVVAAPPPAREDRQPFSWSSLPLLGPAFVLLAGLFVAPIGYAFYLAFTRLDLLGVNSQDYSFRGTENLHRLLQDTVFHHAIVVTLIYLGATLAGQTVLGLALALLMQRALAAIRVTVATIVVVAWVIPEITAGLLWYGFAQRGGTLAALTGNSQQNLLLSIPLVIVTLASVWRNAAFSMLIFSAGLRGIPAEVHEAAALEGASAVTRLWKITIPLLRQTFVTNLLLSLLINLQSFTLVYAMTQGGPNNATMTLPVYSYQEAFGYYHLGYGTMVGVVMLVVGAILGSFFVRHSAKQALI
jgi:multiple sugar transport system permease protein